ncbi:MAG: TA system antitoxin ParD family protein [Candidatus Methylomirabilales bacterium]
MSNVTTLRMKEELRNRIAAKARAQRRSLSEQISYYAYLGMIAEENPDLPLAFIRDILEAREEVRGGLREPYQWSKPR